MLSPKQKERKGKKDPNFVLVALGFQTRNGFPGMLPRSFHHHNATLQQGKFWERNRQLVFVKECYGLNISLCPYDELHCGSKNA